MLAGLSRYLTGDLLKVLCDMGHSDVAIVADANFPAHRVNRRVIEIPGLDTPGLLRVLSGVFPIDADNPPFVMDDGTGRELPIQREMLDALGWAGAPTFVNRWDFYPRASDAYVVIQCGERRAWGDIGIAKGFLTAQD